MPRRPNNEGSVYFDASQNVWVCTVPFLRPDGTRHNKKSKHRSQRDAEARRRALVRDRGDFGTPGMASGTTVNAWANFAREYIWPRSGRGGKPIAKTTLRQYEWILADYILPAFGSREIGSITAIDVEMWMSTIPLPSVRQAAFRLAKSLFSKAVKPYRIIPYSPFEALEPPAFDPEESCILTPAEVARVLRDGNPPDWLQGMIRVAAGCGLRKGEIVALKWENIDLVGRSIHVCIQYDEVSKVERLPKGGKARTVPMPPMVAGWLWDWHRAHGAPKTGLVWPTTSGRHKGQRNVTRAYHLALEKAGLEKSRFHNLRKTCASALMSAGSDPRIRSAILGHATPDVTESVYTQAVFSALVEASDRAEKQFE